eukprot:2401286-Pleurochrysis_carterae.AAC.1
METDVLVEAGTAETTEDLGFEDRNFGGADSAWRKVTLRRRHQRLPFVALCSSTYSLFLTHTYTQNASTCAVFASAECAGDACACCDTEARLAPAGRDGACEAYAQEGGARGGLLGAGAAALRTSRRQAARARAPGSRRRSRRCRRPRVAPGVHARHGDRYSLPRSSQFLVRPASCLFLAEPVLILVRSRQLDTSGYSEWQIQITVLTNRHSTFNPPLLLGEGRT